MTAERTRRATEAVDTHVGYLEAQHDGSTLNRIERMLLDPSVDPNDVRYGHQDFLYANYEPHTFSGMMRHVVNEAMTFQITTDLFREVLLTVDMMNEEGIDWLPLHPTMVPHPTGFLLFPYGVECPSFFTAPLEERTVHEMKDGKLVSYDQAIDPGNGDRWFMDGFVWTRSDRVGKDGHAGEPVPGMNIMPLTRWRGRDGDRPFRLARTFEPKLAMPEIVGSDLTAWAFDDPGETEWTDPIVNYEMTVNMDVQAVSADDPRVQGQIANLNTVRWWTRSIVWATWRWLTDEIWIEEQADRASTRRMKRARPVHDNPPQEDGVIRIVDLRPERKEWAANDTTGEPPWWRTRWTVRGHWARRRYSLYNEDGTTRGPRTGPDSQRGVTFEYRKVWIDSYEKGPEWAPLVLKDRVGMLDR